EQRQGLERAFGVERAHRPQSAAPVEPDRAESIGFGKLADLAPAQPGAQPHIAHRNITVATAGDEGFHALLPETPDLVEAHAQRMHGADGPAHVDMALRNTRRIEPGLFQRALPTGRVDVERADFHAMLGRIAYELGRLV